MGWRIVLQPNGRLDTHTPRDGMARTAVSLINDWSTEETPAWGIHLTTKTRGDRVRQLTIAGALVAAEIDRLERLAARGEPQPCDAPSDDELQAQGSRENEALFRGWLKRVAELEPAAARELERSGYARFLPLDLRPRDQLAEDRRLVARLCALDSGLSDWEVSFVDSLSKRVEGGLTLTDRQRERALQIDER